MYAKASAQPETKKDDTRAEQLVVDTHIEVELSMSIASRTGYSSREGSRTLRGGSLSQFKGRLG
eukprot:5104018-Prymnesium_polylepis.1